MRLSIAILLTFPFVSLFAQAPVAPVRPVVAAGHGWADSKAQEAALYADIFSFALWQTGHPEFQPATEGNASAQE